MPDLLLPGDDSLELKAHEESLLGLMIQAKVIYDRAEAALHYMEQNYTYQNGEVDLGVMQARMSRESFQRYMGLLREVTDLHKWLERNGGQYLTAPVRVQVLG